MQVHGSHPQRIWFNYLGYQMGTETLKSSAGDSNQVCTLSFGVLRTMAVACAVR